MMTARRGVFFGGNICSKKQEFLNNIVGIQKDKKLHFFAGLALSSFGFVFPVLFSLGFIAGVVKEIHDYFFPNHNVEILDCLYTWAGASIPLILWIIIAK